MGRYLPREGLTLEVVLAPLGWTLFEPIFTGLILILLTYYPNQLESFLPKGIQSYTSSARVLFTLKLLLGLGIIIKLNSNLSRLALNNYTSSTWDHGKEVVVVTGGTGGLGKALAFAFAPSSAAVIILDIVEPNANEVYPKNVHFYRTDLTSVSQLSKTAKLIRASHGHPTVLINNATKSFNKTILDTPDANLQQVFGVNLFAHFRTVKEFLPEMIKRDHGHVVTIASVSSFTVRAQDVEYACTKTAQLAFHEGLGQELRWNYGAKKVRTSIVHCGYIRTPPAEKLIARLGPNELVLEPETIAEAVVKQVHSGYGAQMFVPTRFGAISGFRGWPSWMQDLVRDSLAGQLE